MRIRKGYINTIIPIITLIFASPFVISSVLHNINLNRFANNLFRYPLPKNTATIEKIKEVGCLIANGNHCDYLAIMKVTSKLSKEELHNYYNKNLPSAACGHESVKVDVFKKDEAEMPFDSRGVYEQARNLSIENIGKNADTNEYQEYIIQIFDSNYPAGFDIRCN